MIYLEDFIINHIVNEYDWRTHLIPNQECLGVDVLLDNKYVYCRSDNIKTTIGRYLAKHTSYSPSEITHMCEKIKAFLTDSGNFKIISGEDISKAYYYKNNVPNHGTLSHSCMRYLKCQKYNYFKIYKACAKMLIMTPKRGSRVMGRALLWPYEDTYLMDRVYSTESYVEHQFYEYAKSNKWGVLNKNKYVNVFDEIVQSWLIKDDDYKTPHKLKVDITVPESIFVVPYMDSFCYFDDKTNVLSTYPHYEKSYVLKGTNGFGYYTLFHKYGKDKDYN